MEGAHDSLYERPHGWLDHHKPLVVALTSHLDLLPEVYET
jgi:hypothetical protein